MNHSTLPPQESIDKQLIEEISKLQQDSLGEGAAVCEVCGEELREGASVVVFAFRPVDRPTFEIGHVKCSERRHDPTRKPWQRPMVRDDSTDPEQETIPRASATGTRGGAR